MVLRPSSNGWVIPTHFLLARLLLARQQISIRRNIFAPAPGEAPGRQADRRTIASNMRNLENGNLQYGNSKIGRGK
jgi:hypothetical protein